jgi:channel protein (hemolysin III family)
MKNKDSVELIEYTKAQDALNCVTHALGAIFGAAVLVLLIKKALPLGNARYTAAAVVYGLSIILLYGSSAVYHGLPQGSGQPVLSITPLYRFCSPALRPRARS